MSIARQVAYSNGVANIPGSEEDPQGWHTLKSARISGQIFGQRTVEVEYTVREIPSCRKAIILPSLLAFSSQTCEPLGCSIVLITDLNLLSCRTPAAQSYLSTCSSDVKMSKAFTCSPIQWLFQ